MSPATSPDKVGGPDWEHSHAARRLEAHKLIEKVAPLLPATERNKVRELIKAFSGEELSETDVDLKRAGDVDTGRSTITVKLEAGAEPVAAGFTKTGFSKATRPSGTAPLKKKAPPALARRSSVVSWRIVSLCAVALILGVIAKRRSPDGFGRHSLFAVGFGVEPTPAASDAAPLRRIFDRLPLPRSPLALVVMAGTTAAALFTPAPVALGIELLAAAASNWRPALDLVVDRARQLLVPRAPAVAAVGAAPRGPLGSLMWLLSSGPIFSALGQGRPAEALTSLVTRRLPGTGGGLPAATATSAATRAASAAARVQKVPELALEWCTSRGASRAIKWRMEFLRPLLRALRVP